MVFVCRYNDTSRRCSARMPSGSGARLLVQVGNFDTEGGKQYASIEGGKGSM